MTNGRDLGTYHLRVDLLDGRGWIDTWSTGARYTNGSAEHSPLSAYRIQPLYDAESDLFDNMVFMYTEGNWSCDCNKTLFWCRAQQLEEPEDVACGDTMALKRLTAIRPDGTETVLWQAQQDDTYAEDATRSKEPTYEAPLRLTAEDNIFKVPK